MSETFYVTTAIDYPNGSPHIGHLYEKVVADTYARWNRFLGNDVFFLTGTDENGQKLVKAAEQANASSTREFIDANVEQFRKLCTDIGITNDDFIRTTEERHERATHHIWKKLEEKGDIYFDRYSGNYCFGCEAFYTEAQAEDQNCPEHGTKLEYVEEDGYFFKMSAYQDWIINHIEADPNRVFPSSARKEILSRLKGDKLKDLSISRPNSGWGIVVPGNDKHVVYTWFDALINYYSAVWDIPERKHYWPASMHVIGKDITWFHTVIWPIMLHASGIDPAQQVYVHGMLLGADGKKMSKSLGNVVSLDQLIGVYPDDVIRYYMLRAVASGQDGSFSIDDLEQRNNSELANDFGNLALRIIKLSAKRLGDTVEYGDAAADFDFRELGEQVKKHMDQREHHRALDSIWEGINKVNAYLNTHEPWRIKEDPAKFHHHMVNGLYAVHCISTLLIPFLPSTAEKTLAMLGTENKGIAGLAYGEQRFVFGETQALFPKIEKESN